ncbi:MULTISPECIES: helix-turn-helix transcriptional regulator [Brevibacterium]|uniref:LuxR C-terminal-related transcriptional regulator n=1 Tax=Brevibacterium ammoniilyticum TaxID=1046555 RepID=A0ABP9U325_9MICO
MPPAHPPHNPTGIPRIGARAVPRTALLNRLDALAPVTVVQGLCGCGKTTLAAQWAHHRHADGDEVRWVDAADADAILTALRDTGGSGRRRIVVGDNAHHLGDPSVLERIVASIAADPLLHLLLCSRIDHPLARLSKDAGIETVVLSGRHLNISAGQVQTYAGSWGHEITDEHAHRLHGELGGWLGLLRWALDHADSHYDSSGRQAATQYLQANILPLITDRNALVSAMMIGATGYVSMALLVRVFDCDGPAGHLLGGRTLTELIDGLTRHGILEPAHAAAGAIRRFPTFLATLLTDLLEADHPALAQHVHATAAEWFAAQLPMETDEFGGLAGVHARAAGDWDRLAEIWRERGFSVTIRHPEHAREAYSDIPDHRLADHPELALAASVISTLDAGFDRRRGRTIIGTGRPPGWAMTTASPAAGIVETTAEIIAARHRGDVVEALRLASEFSAADLEPRSSENSLLARAWFDLQWALASFAAQDTPNAVRHLSAAAHSAHTVRAEAIESAATAQLALINAVAGYARSAAKRLDELRTIESGRRRRRPRIHAGRIAEGLLRLDGLDPGALECFDIPGADELEEWAILAWARTQHALLFDDPMVALTEVNRVAFLHQQTSRAGSRNRRLIDRCIADLYLALGELNRAQRHLGDADPDHRTLGVPRTRLAFICGDYPGARSTAATLAWNPEVSLRDRIDLVLLKAASAHEMGDIDTARLTMARAVSLAASANTLMPYTALPRDVCRALLALVDHDLGERDLSLIDAHRQPYPDRGELVVLSAREAVVLGAMVEHETLAEVADALVVSPNTVKKQARAVYAKLGVHDRQAALLEAHRLGLLPEGSAGHPGPEVT